MSSQLALASLLSTMTAEQLTTVLEVRAVAHPEAIRDALDLAGALLKPDSIHRALRSSSREVLELLSGQNDTQHDEAVAAALILPGETIPQSNAVVRMPEVSEVLAELLSETPLTQSQLTQLPDRDSHSGDVNDLTSEDDLQATERAFDSVRLVSQLLRESEEHPFTLRQHDVLSSAIAKRVAQELARQPEEISAFVKIMLTAGLLAPGSGARSENDTFANWDDQSLSARYIALTRNWLQHSDTVLRHVLTEWAGQQSISAEQLLQYRYPLASAEKIAELAELCAQATRLGLMVNGRLTTVGVNLIGGHDDAASDLVERAFPQTVTQVYVQPDLTIIAPGPLESTSEKVLLTFAQLESSGVASTYRITASTLEASLSSGVDEQKIRDFLEQVSLTGIPQPLDYLLSEATRRHGSIVVREPAEEALAEELSTARAQSWVSCADASVTAQLRVDRALNQLGLNSVSETEVWSLFSPEQVAQALRSAGYPVTLESSRSEPGHEAEEAVSAQTPRLHSVVASRIVEVASHELSGGSHERLLELAVRQKQRVRVVMHQVNDREREFVLRPVGLRNGRLRGIDETAQVERTLPVADLIVVEHLSA